MKVQNFIIITTLSLLIYGSVFYVLSNFKITDSSDYQKFMQREHLEKAKEKLNTQINFWESKLESNPENFVYQKKLAGLYGANFKLTGDIKRLSDSDKILTKINDRIPNQVGILHALSANAITRHDFRAAEKYADEALEVGEKKFVSTLLKTDALLERGNLWDARNLMHDVASISHFDFLIRNVKLNDQSGDLDAAIKDMEAALKIAKDSGNKDLINWSLSNLADMYGHDGRITKSYKTYLEALSHNPADLHSLKGIAWIAFSHDKDTEEAKRIISFLKSIHPIPDYDLLLAEIATYEGNNQTAESYENDFLAKASRPEYGKMYQSYIGYLNENADEALKIAESEIENRPHPMSYNLLAWATLQKGEKQKAVDILEKYVIGQTEEPDALFYTGIILKEAGDTKQAKQFLKEALDASFELGPVAALEIESHLESL